MDEHFARDPPEHKADHVKELQSKRPRVADGRRWCERWPAIAHADNGSAIGTGTDAVIGTADVVLVRPRDAARVVGLSRVSYRKMLRKPRLGDGIHVVAIPLAAGVPASLGILLSPAGGALLMSVSTLIVAMNAQRSAEIRTSSVEPASMAL